MKKSFKIVLKVFLWILVSFIFLSIFFIVLIRLPSVQNYITHKATSYISSKTHTRIELKRFYVGFPKSIVMEGLYAEDPGRDTLLYLEKLELDMDLMGLMSKRATVSKLFISGLNAHIRHNSKDSSFNFGFFLHAFDNNSPEKSIKPEDTSSGWEIGLQTIELLNFHTTYIEEQGGMNISASWGELNLNFKGMDIRSSRFNLDEVSVADGNESSYQNGGFIIQVRLLD